MEINWAPVVRKLTLQRVNGSLSEAEGRLKEKDLVVLVCETELGYPLSKNKQVLTGRSLKFCDFPDAFWVERTLISKLLQVWGMFSA